MNLKNFLKKCSLLFKYIIWLIFPENVDKKNRIFKLSVSKHYKYARNCLRLPLHFDIWFKSGSFKQDELEKIRPKMFYHLWKLKLFFLFQQFS